MDPFPIGSKASPSIRRTLPRKEKKGKASRKSEIRVREGGEATAALKSKGY